ncbi:LOW QUALITY PROTEIN: X box binding protein 1 [Cotesia typhae]|uniref:LOW QUALITY PROTEIN: X box binding protein 1 n=1 Tax=Cotesia typhae TaxID=2053667 RepID=UPI003D692170
MISPKSVIITLPKGLQKSPVISPVRNIIKPTGNLNFTTSILATKSKVDAKNMQKIQHDCYGDVQGELMKTDIWLRGKKRRLDHLSWEEKLQRKKLKNRVAAQTSRDRKKAKLDELEETVRTLIEKNELITEECDSLRAQNKALLAENQRLKEGDKSVNKTDSDRYCSMCMGRVGCVAPALGSAVSPINPLPQGGATQLALSNTVSKCGNSVEDIDALPHLEELFADIQSDGYVERLEELAESLLREVTAGVEAHAQRPNEQVTIKKDTFEEFDDSKKMVGPASKNVEASPICSSLILYPKESTPFPAQYVDKSSIPELFKRQVKIKQEPVSDVDTVYGTYDEATNCITIIYPGEDDAIRIDECVQEVSSDESANLTPNYYNNVSPFYSIADSMSPSSMHSDDSDANSVCYKMKSNISNCGYESHDFPQAERHTDTATPIDLWHESFSELFPSLV